MRLLRTMRLLVLGETWALPFGIAAILVAGALLRHAEPRAWHHAGGFLLLAGVMVVLAASLARSGR